MPVHPPFDPTRERRRERVKKWHRAPLYGRGQRMTALRQRRPRPKKTAATRDWLAAHFEEHPEGLIEHAKERRAA